MGERIVIEHATEKLKAEENQQEKPTVQFMEPLVEREVHLDQMDNDRKAGS